MSLRRLLLLASVLSIAACGGTTTTPDVDAGVDGATGDDAGSDDGGSDGAIGDDAGSDGAIGDDAGSDAGGATPDGGGAGPDGVRCVGVSSDCAVGEVCCGGSVGIVCQAASDTCTGEVLACDGTEDCPGARCCGIGGGTACQAACDVRICHSSAECEAGESCCPNGGGVPYGALTHCLALDPGTSCPLPP